MTIKILIELEERFPSIIGYVYYIISSLAYSGAEYYIGRMKGINTF